MFGEINLISVIGLGYVGLPTAAVIANRGIQVIGVDVDPNVIAAITQPAESSIFPTQKMTTAVIRKPVTATHS